MTSFINYVRSWIWVIKKDPPSFEELLVAAVWIWNAILAVLIVAVLFKELLS